MRRSANRRAFHLATLIEVNLAVTKHLTEGASWLGSEDLQPADRSLRLALKLPCRP